MLRPNAPCWILASALLFASCAAEAPPEEAAAPKPTAASLIAEGPHDRAVLDLGDLGSITIELLPELAPKTVDNFVKLSSDGFYTGTTFHRVIPDFMIQGGDPNTRDPDPRNDGQGGPGYNIEDEFNAMPHERGVVSMANRSSPNSAGSQFFIVHARAESLDGKYTAFGRVVEGMDVVDAVTKLEIDTYGRYGPRDRPYPVSATISGVTIESAAISRAGRATP